MKRMLVGLLPLLLLSCDSSTSVERPCFMRVGPSSAPIPVVVTYSASSEGDASITEITYRTEEGDQVVKRPNLPWQKVVGMGSKKSVEMSADAVVEDGSLRIAMKVVGDEGGTTIDQTEEDTCTSSGR